MESNLKPLVSVLMSVYNAEKYLKEAIQSVLTQTYENFEFIIVDDGSEDNSLSIINQIKDERIRLIVNEKNKGLIYSLNKGLETAVGKYVIRMDADDISDPERFDTQIRYMEKHPEIGISGTAYQSFGEGFSSKTRILESNPLQNKADLMFYPVLAHPSVIMRKSVLDENNLRYSEEFKNAEDYGLWVEASNFTKISNIRKKLLNYRILDKSITRQANKDFNSRFNIHKKIYQLYFERIGLHLSDQELLLHFIISDNNRFRDNDRFSSKQIDSYFKKLNQFVGKLPHSKYYQQALSKRKLGLAIIKKRKTQVFLNAISYFYFTILSRLL